MAKITRKKLKIRTFFDDSVKVTEYGKIKTGIVAFTSHYLDELQIEVTIESYEDIKDLIKLLQCVEPCFYKVCNKIKI